MKRKFPPLAGFISWIQPIPKAERLTKFDISIVCIALLDPAGEVSQKIPVVFKLASGICCACSLSPRISNSNP
ncbi:MAG: hypothetical protein WCJ66_06155 [Verrucomicrobiota bacterium]